MLLNKNILAIGIVFLFVCSAFIPMSLGINTRITDTRGQPSTFSRGKTLYVGGTGEDNYTSIQDAIDDAVDGDTVFVYDDSSPYLEYDIIISKSINLIGENKHTTVIDGLKKANVTIVKNTDNVNISGLTIKNSSYRIDNGFIFGAGVRIIKSDNCIVFNNNIIENGRFGVIVDGGSQYTLIEKNNFIGNKWAGIYLGTSTYCIIKNNVISNNYRGISIWVASGHYVISGNIISENRYGLVDASFDSFNYIENNTFSNNEDGLRLGNVDGNSISGNIISGSDIGIFTDFTYSQDIFKNTISNCNTGIFLLHSYDNLIRNNNFIDNEKDGVYNSSIVLEYRTNRWRNNYYSSNIGIFPKFIFGWISFSYIPWWDPWEEDARWIVFNWFPIIDWSPAKEPYDI